MYEKFFLLAALLIASAGSGYAALIYAQNLFGTATLPRAIYSGLLIVVAILLVREISNVWKPGKVGIGKFEVSDSGDVDTIRAAALRGLIEQRYNLVRTAFERENQRRKDVAPDADGVILERVPVPTPEATLGKASNALSEIELTFQGVNFGQIFSSLRRRVAPPNEITGQVVDKDGIAGVVNWPRGPKFDHLPLENVRIMTFERLQSDGDLALKIACSLVWAQVVEAGESTATQMGRVDYCTWVEAFLLSQRLRQRINAGLDVERDDQERIADAIDALAPLVANATPYSEVYWTQSDLMRLQGRSRSAAQADRFEQLALLIEQGTSAADARSELIRREEVVTTAEARAAATVKLAQDIPDQIAQLRGPRPVDLSEQPVLPMALAPEVPEVAIESLELSVEPVSPGVPVDPQPEPVPGVPADPADEEEAARERILAISQSTGFVRLPQSLIPFSGTAFVVAPDVIVTADFLFGGAGGAGSSGSVGQFPVVFSTAGTIDGGGKEFEAFLLSRHPERQIAFLRVPGLQDAGILPVPLADAEPPTGTEVGVVAYPVFDPRLPPNAQLVGRDDETRKTLLPGQITDIPISTNAEGPLVYNNVPTSGGSSGGPLLDVESGTVMGLHLGGVLVDGEKRNYAALLLAADPILP